MMQLFHNASNKCSRVITMEYSTSFGAAIKLLHAHIRPSIYNIYGFVRLADEIVDSFHEFKKEELLHDFKTQTFKAIEEKISLNPILHSFQQAVNQHGIDHALIHAFFNSMEMDLHRTQYNVQEYQTYIYGSAEVVGLMCLYVFCEGDKKMFAELQPFARSLGAAFQKINFLRDIQADYMGLNRLYFPDVDFENFTQQMKTRVETEVAADLQQAYEGICQLPDSARYGVLLAYKYYFSLFKKIQRTQPTSLLTRRMRVPDYQKLLIFFRTGLKYQLRFAHSIF